MTLRELEYLLAVVRYGHVGRAAVACHVSQSTLSIQLKKLEETLGIELFERTGKTLRLTATGQAVCHHAEKMLQEAAAIRAVAMEAKDPASGIFSLGVFPTLAPYWLPSAVPRLKEAFPNLSWRLVEEKTPTLLSLLRAGKLDAAVLAQPVAGDDLHSAVLFSEDFLAALPLGHPLADKSTLNASDLDGQKLLLLEEGHCLRGQALAVCTENGASEDESGYRATSLETLRQMVIAGEGMTLMPACAAVEGAGIIYRPFVNPSPKRTLALYWRASSARRKVCEEMGKILTAL